MSASTRSPVAADDCWSRATHDANSADGSLPHSGCNHGSTSRWTPSNSPVASTWCCHAAAAAWSSSHQTSAPSAWTPDPRRAGAGAQGPEPRQVRRGRQVSRGRDEQVAYAVPPGEVDQGRDTRPVPHPHRAGAGRRRPRRGTRRDGGGEDPEHQHGGRQEQGRVRGGSHRRTLRGRAASPPRPDWAGQPPWSRGSRPACHRGGRSPRCRRSRARPRGRRRRPPSASVRTTAASRPCAPDETAIATATPSAETCSDGRSTVAAAYVRPSTSRTAAPSAARVRARVLRARVTSLASSGRERRLRHPHPPGGAGTPGRSG